MVNSRIAIIPARGGSERIPQKNIIDFDGKPMIAWTISSARKSGLFDHIIVSTDDDEIAAISREWGAEVPFLRDQFADAHSPVSPATISALKQAEDHWASEFDMVAQLMPNCPLRDDENIKSAVDIFENGQRKFQISCFKFGWMNPWWAAKLDHDGRPDKCFPEIGATRSQDLPHLYCPTGATWIASGPALKKAHTFYGPDHRFEPMPWANAVDIDDYDDLKFALLAKNISNSD